MTGIRVTSETKVYVLLPSNGETGGLEVLHQLVYMLRKHLNINAFLYWPYDAKLNPIARAYADYKNPVIYTAEDAPRNIFIYPEINPSSSCISNYKNICKVMWWLSVDNFYISIVLSSKLNFFFQRLINKTCRLFNKEDVYDVSTIILERISKLSKNLREDRMVSQANFHFCQSIYARDFLIKDGLSQEMIFNLSDYLNEDFLKINTPRSGKENIVAYNPKKGFLFTKKIIESDPDIKFVQLVNMSRQQMIETLQRAKVYIDFGNHPGKDRIPREAAILGCCVITGKRGSAAFYEDIPISDEYKFDDKEESIHGIIHLIKDCMENYEERYKDFEQYRSSIKEEPSKFIADLRKIFVG